MQGFGMDVLAEALEEVIAKAAEKLQVRPLYVLLEFASGERYSFVVRHRRIDFEYKLKDKNLVFPVQVLIMDRPNLKTSKELAHATITLLSGGVGQKSELHAQLQFHPEKKTGLKNMRPRGRNPR